MRILLIFPPKEQIAIKGIKFTKELDNESGSYPPLGLLYIATYLKQTTSYEVEILDAPMEKYTYPDLERHIRQAKPDIVGIYFCTEYLIDAIKTAELAKKIDNKIIVVAGGPHVTIYPQETINYKSVDYGVYGEGEFAFKEFVDALSSGRDPKGIDGVLSKSIGAGQTKMLRVEDLNSIPIPDRRLIDYKKYASIITFSNPVTTMMTSRGCSFNCYYCSAIERSQKVRFRNAQNVVNEIEAITELGIRDIIFFDENFTLDIRRVEDICDIIISKKIKVRWQCRSRADMKLEPAILRKMKDAGCRIIQLGIETGNQRLQEVINKKLNLEKVTQTINLVKNAGILTYGNFMLGIPTETSEEMLKTINFAIGNNLDYATFSNFHPIPKTVFYENGLRDGIIKEDYWLKFAKDPSEQVTKDWWPEQDNEQLTKMNKLAFNLFNLSFKNIFRSLVRKQSFKQKLWLARAAMKLFFAKWE